MIRKNDKCVTTLWHLHRLRCGSVDSAHGTTVKHVMTAERYLQVITAVVFCSHHNLQRGHVLVTH